MRFSIPLATVSVASSPSIARQDAPCNKFLLTQSAVEECVIQAGGFGVPQYGWVTCPGEPTENCCEHRHLALNWKICLPAAAETGAERGPMTSKAYTKIASDCLDTEPYNDNDWDCVVFEVPKVDSKPCEEGGGGQ